MRRGVGVINSALDRVRKRAAQNSPLDLKVRKVAFWDIPGNDCRPRMISRRLSCSEMRSSDIIRPNITREMN